MESLEEIKARAELAVPGAQLELVPNPGPANQPSFLLDDVHARAVAQFLRDDPALLLDHCSNMKDRMAILDSPPGLAPQDIKKWRDSDTHYDSAFGMM